MISVHRGGGMQGVVLGFSGGGDITMDDELEEGEYNPPYRADDNFEPDEYSYIDVKLSRILRHAQQDFLSGAPLESLGPMTGGYGSFLPSYARSPSLLGPPRCRNNLPLEVVNQSGSAPLRKLLGITAPKAALMDAAANGDLYITFSQGPAKFNPKHSNVKQSVDPVEQKAHLVPVKVDPEKNLTQINAKLYSGLGLDESPTSSEEGSAVDNKGFSPESEAKFDHLLCLIEEMVSFPIPDGSFLTPLPEHMLCLFERVILPNDSLPGFAHEGSNLKSSSKLVQECTDRSNGKPGENKIKLVERSSKELNNVRIMHAGNGIIPYPKGKDTEFRKEKVSESLTKHNAARVESWNSKASSAEKLSEDRKASPHRDVQLNHNKDIAKKGDLRYETYHAEHNVVKDRKVLNGGLADSLRQKVGQEASAIKKDSFKKSNMKEQWVSEGKVKQKESQCNVASASEFPKGRFSIDSFTVTESKTKSSENYPSKGNLGNNKLRKESSKSRDNDRDPIRGMEGAVKTGGSVDNLIGDGPKESPLHDAGKEIQALATKQKGILDVKNSSNSLTSKANQVAAPVVGSLTGNTAPLNVASAVVNPVVINENWVCCDRCGRWRLLPFGTDAEHLQKKKWLCSMLDWLPGMNRCDISEGETTRAIYALFQIPMPESQNNPQGIPAPESNLVNERHFRQTHQQPAMPNVEKKPERRDTYNPDKTDLLNPARKQLPTPGDAKHSKTNSKRWVDDDGSQPSKKLKAEKLYGANGEWNTDNGQTMGKVSSELNNHPAKELAKDAQKRSKYSSSKDLKSDSKDRVSVSVKNPKGQVSLDSRAIDTGKYDEIGGSAKKRKFNEWQENQIYSPGSDPSNAKASPKLTGEIKVNEGKKAQVSMSELKDSSASNGSGKSDRKGRVIRVPISSSPKHNRTEEKVRGPIKKDQQPGIYGYENTGCKQTLDGIDSLKKDSATATSSSSKVSGSLKGKSNFQEPKGSPVESVSSSPLRISNVGKVVAAKRNLMGENDITDAGFSSMSSPRRCVDGGSHVPGTARKEKAAPAIQHKSLEPFGDHDQQKDANGTSGKVKASIESFSGSESSHRASGCAGIIDQRSSEVQCVEQGQRMGVNGNHYQSGGSLPAEGSYLQSKDRRVSSTSVPDKSNAKVSGSFSKPEEFHSAKNLRYEMEIGSQEHRELRDNKYSLKGPVKSSKEEKSHLAKEDSASKRSGDSVCAIQSKSGRVEGSDVKGVASCSKNGKTNGAVSRDLDEPIAVRKDSSVQAADSAIKEAKNLKHKADRLKNAISELEFIGLYFQAALKFLYGASLSEPSNYDNSKHIEMTRSMQLYGETAKLCEFVAQQYERHKEMASAALAYKCMEVAYMRIIYSTNPIMKKDWLDLQMALPPLGESPSSSASDVDNANNQIMMGKGATAKGLPASHISGNHLILAHNRPSFARLLDQVQDVFHGMESLRNAQNAFAVAILGRQDKKHGEGISSVKRVVDYNFHDVEGLLHLVRSAVEAISR